MNTELSEYSIANGGRGAGATGAEMRRLLLLATIVTVALGFLPYSEYLLYPIRLFTTFVHESGHALATLAVGGGVASLAVHPDTSGVTMSMGVPFWARWIMYSGGYVGTAVFGALLLQVGRMRNWQSAGRMTLYAASLSLLAITLLWGRDLFTLVMGVAISGLMALAARFTTPRMATFLAAFLAVQCSLNALIDIRTLLFLTTRMPGSDNDALFMQQTYALPAWLWAGLWALTAVVVMGVSVWSYLRGTSERAARFVD